LHAGAAADDYGDVDGVSGAGAATAARPATISIADVTANAKAAEADFM
jgi:hypothetical protein